MFLCSSQLAWHWPLRRKAGEWRYHSTALHVLLRASSHVCLELDIYHNQRISRELM
ncbi:hypothetical protein CFP56_008201 [Quercus suber]|uniref:Uncharacterized protein n=1 Tax=Quercus suber TaxID=58331 RepID=A0AAW0L771_QUESU